MYLLHSLWPTYSSIRTVDWSPSITETMAVVFKRWCFHVIRFVSYLFGLDGSFKPPLIRPVFIFFSWKREVFDFCLGGTVPFRRARFWIAHFFSGDKAGPLVGSKCRTRWEARLWVEAICCGWLSIRCWLLTTRNLCVPSQGGAKGSDPVRSMRL